MPNVKTTELTGVETAVKFDKNYSCFWVQNLGDSNVLMSVSPGIVPDADGVMLIPAKSGRSTGDVGQVDTLYLSGSGKVEITAQYNAVCPFFKYAGKGGDGNAESNILPNSEGLTYYFDYQKNITDTSWTDMVSGYKINDGIVRNADYTGLNQLTQLNWAVKNTFTAYCVSKCISDADNTETVGFFGTENNAKNDWFMLVRTPKNAFGLVFGSSAIGYETTISASNYHVLSWNFFDGTVSFYVDGRHIVTKTNIQTLDHWKIGGARGVLPCFKMVAFFENVAQGADSIAENSRYIAQKYGLQI